MKRLHLHLAVDDLDENIQFYSTLFAAEPSVLHQDYAKWMLEDPRINFAISNRSSKHGLDHLGLQVDDAKELQHIKTRLDATQLPVESQPGTACCYMRSDKHWITDPQGIAWETFQSLSDISTFNDGVGLTGVQPKNSCCTPGKPTVSNCFG